jgi:hypothetical protein
MAEHSLWQIVTNAGDDLPAEFRDWLVINIPVWVEFERHALAVARRGCKHYSSKTIVEVMRHEGAIREKSDSGFKINNVWTRPLAQLFMLAHPELPNFFELREPPKDML